MPRLPRQLEALDRMLNYIFCHRPDEFGLIPAEDGSLSLKQLLQALVKEPGWGFVRRHHLVEVAVLSQPPRFELAGERLRCLSPGPAQLRRPPGEPPPALLYLAIPPKVHPRVWEQGLKPPPEQELVLASTPETALKLGRRRAPDPVLITIAAQAAAKSGINFQGYGEELFLAPGLPRDFLQMRPPPQTPEKPQPEKGPRPSPTPGAVMLDLWQLGPKPPRPRGKKGEPAWKSGTRALRKKRRSER
jgi:putative RNA 2'-phosphotransferase